MSVQFNLTKGSAAVTTLGVTSHVLQLYNESEEIISKPLQARHYKPSRDVTRGCFGLYVRCFGPL
jgi:hypothetical protein